MYVTRVLFPPPFAPHGSLVMPACFIASCSISKPIARLFFLVPSCTIWCRFHLWPPFSPTPFPVSCVYTLHLPDDSIVSFQSPCLSFSTSFFFLISYFLPLLSVCTSTAKCYPFLLFSVCLCVLGPVLSPQLSLQMDFLSKETHNHLQTSLFNHQQQIYSCHFCRLLLAG